MSNIRFVSLMSVVCLLVVANGAAAQSPTTTAASPPPETVTAAQTAAAAEPVVTAPTAAPAAEEEPPQVEVRLGEGVRFRAGDAFSLQIRARMQLQGGFVTPSSNAVDEGAAADVTTNFQARRVRLVMTGHAFTPKLRYYFQLGFSYRDMESDRLVAVRDAYMTWQPHRDFGLRWGQMKVPYGLQRVVSSSALQMVDRSIVTAEFNLDRDVGVYMMSEDLGGLGGKLMYQAGVFGGRGRNRFDGVDEAMFVARFQVNPFGSFDHLSEGDMTRSHDPRLAIGFGGAYHFNSVRSRGTHQNTYTFADFDMIHVGGDVHFKWAGLTVMAEVFYRSSDAAHRTRVDPTNPAVTQIEYARRGVGWYLQTGYMFPRMIEVVGRFGEIRSTVDTIAGTAATAAGGHMGNEREAGGGLNYYIVKHALKVQLDYFRIWDPDDAADDRHQVRLQTQIYF